MAEAGRINRVHRSLSRPLTILGAERKLFFFAMCLGAATFNLLNSLFGGLLMFLLLYFMARWATQTDPQILRFLLTAARVRAQYDPMKFTPITIRRDGHAQAKPNSQKLQRHRFSVRANQSLRLYRSANVSHEERRHGRHPRSARGRLRMPRQRI